MQAPPSSVGRLGLRAGESGRSSTSSVRGRSKPTLCKNYQQHCKLAPCCPVFRVQPRINPLTC
eukprot:jgi/Botrbrau1/17601/Bobra.0166s0038.1